MHLLTRYISCVVIKTSEQINQTNTYFLRRHQRVTLMLQVSPSITAVNTDTALFSGVVLPYKWSCVGCRAGAGVVIWCQVNQTRTSTSSQINVKKTSGSGYMQCWLKNEWVYCVYQFHIHHSVCCLLQSVFEDFPNLIFTHWTHMFYRGNCVSHIYLFLLYFAEGSCSAFYLIPPFGPLNRQTCQKIHTHTLVLLHEG